MRISSRGVLSVPLILTLAGPAHAATFHAAASHGTDAPGCGTKAAPCRSISAAIDAARDGDTIVVGPGRYGDANRDGDTGDPGDEPGLPFCGCVLGIGKEVTIVSSDGASATTIDGTTVVATRTVLFLTNGATLGKPGKGFTITNPREQNGAFDIVGVGVLGANNAIRGNLLRGFPNASQGPILTFGTGIEVFDTAEGPIRIEANQLSGWSRAIHHAGPAAVTIRKNQVSHNNTGIFADGPAVEVVGNVATENRDGFVVGETARVVGNAAIGNRRTGFQLASDFAGEFTKNNMYGNLSCGLLNSRTNLVATENFWGAPTGPGPYPADRTAGFGGCPLSGVEGQPVVVAPFATRPFAVKAPLRF